MGLFDFALAFSPASVWFWLLCLIGVVWLRRHLDLNRAGKDPVLSSRDAADAPDWPKLTVLVAGKDEEDNIERCLTGLLAQDYPDFRVIAINDRSSDRTGMIIDRMAEQDARLTAVHVDELPEGWGGKNHAMHQGVQEADGEWLLFTDADCQFPDKMLLRAAVSFSRREGVDFLSALPRLEAHTFWEKVVQPPAGAIMVFWFPPEKVNDPRRPHAYANGAFMLMTRSAYDKVGGHEALRAVLNEDMYLARVAKSLGLRLRVIQAGEMFSVRMYSGFGQIWRGWTRIFYGCFGTWLRLIVSSLFLSVFSMLPWLSLLLAPFAGSAAGGVGVAAAFAIIAQQTVLWRFYQLCAMPGHMAVAYPLGAAVCLGIMFNAMTRLAGVKTTWRGTSYQGGA